MAIIFIFTPYPCHVFLFKYLQVQYSPPCKCVQYSAAELQPAPLHAGVYSAAGVYTAWQVLASSQNNAATVGCGHCEAVCSAPAGGHGLILQCGIIWLGEFRTCCSKQDWQYHETSRISNKACWPISAMFSAPPLVGMGACCVSARLVPHGVDFTCCVYFYILCTLATRWMMKWKLSEDDLSMRWLGWLCWARRCCSPTASTPPSTLPSMGAGASSSRIFRWVDIS